MSGSNPHVQVFHFTHRISSAKIRKYKLATERGMGGGSIKETRANRTAESSAPPPLPTSTASNEPPPKKLKLNVRPYTGSPGDTISVARPTQDSSLRIRYDQNMHILPGDEVKPSPAASSDLTSLTSTPPMGVKEPTPQEEVTPTLANDEYGDFMSYYVMDGEEDKPKTKAEVVKSSPAPPPKVQQPVKQYIDHAPRPPTEFRHHMPPIQSYPPPPVQPVPPAPPAPRVELVDFDRGKNVGPNPPDTVLDMTNKLEAVSIALTHFGGVPPVPKTPKEEIEPDHDHDDNPLDSFLGMFEGEGDEDGDASGEVEKLRKLNNPLDYRLERPGTADGPLTHGILFIQNALRSWAQQRLQNHYAERMRHQHHTQAPFPYPQKRGPGRPRKFPDGDSELPTLPATIPQVIHVRLDSQPEGVAIKAFQDVLNCGCLQVNANLPLELTRALRRLYMQIDHLINQGAKQEPPWQCMSYSAQITANKVRVEKWKEAQAKAQEEMARQQQLAQQQLMQQMSLPLPQPGATQAPHAHAGELERRRSSQHMAQQAYLSQHHLNSLPLGSQSNSTSPGFAPSPLLANATNNRSASATQSHPPTPRESIYTTNGIELPPQGGQGTYMDRVKIYVPGLLPRSGQSMKFSFAPQSDAALRAFGAQAFPNADSPERNIPNRGPMNVTPFPSQQSPKKALVPASSSKWSERNASQANGISHASKGNAVPTATGKGSSDAVDIKEDRQMGSALAKANASTSTAVSAPSPIPAGSLVAASPPHSAKLASGTVSASTSPALGGTATTLSQLNAHCVATNLASRFPHPGAVVIDQ